MEKENAVMNFNINFEDTQKMPTMQVRYNIYKNVNFYLKKL